MSTTIHSLGALVKFRGLPRRRRDGSLVTREWRGMVVAIRDSFAKLRPMRPGDTGQLEYSTEDCTCFGTRRRPGEYKPLKDAPSPSCLRCDGTGTAVYTFASLSEIEEAP